VTAEFWIALSRLRNDRAETEKSFTVNGLAINEALRRLRV